MQNLFASLVLVHSNVLLSLKIHKAEPVDMKHLLS